MDREKRAQAGAWLKRAREHRGISVRKLAAHFDVSTQSVYGWEAGSSDWVDDDRAEGLSELLGLGLIEVRRGLGLWVPPDDQHISARGGMTREEFVHLIKTDPRARAEFFDALLDARERSTATGDADSGEPDSGSSERAG